KTNLLENWDSWLGNLQYRITQTPQVLIDNQLFENDAGEMVICWDYAKELFPANLVESMFDAYVGGISTLSIPSAWKSKLSLLPAKDMSIVRDSNSTFFQLTTENLLLQDMYIRQAKLFPN